MGDPNAWEYDYPSPSGMGREVTLSPPWLADPDGVRNGRPLFRLPTLTDAEREALERAVGFCECTTSPLPTSQQIATLRGLLERL